MLGNRDWLGKKVFWNAFNKDEVPYSISEGKVIEDINNKGCYKVLTLDGERIEKPWHVLFGSRISSLVGALRVLKETNIENKDKIFNSILSELQLISYLADDLNIIGISFKALGKNHPL